jgi:hypothetical protein
MRYCDGALEHAMQFLFSLGGRHGARQWGDRL